MEESMPSSSTGTNGVANGNGSGSGSGSNPNSRRRINHKQSLRDRITGLSFEEAPETGQFNSPLPNSAGDTRNLDSLKDKEPKWMDMTGKRGAKRATPAGDRSRGSDEDELGEGSNDDEDDLEGEDGTQPKRKWSNKRNATSTGRRKISIQYIGDKSKRHVSFTKRKAGLMKKAYELSTLTGTNCLVLVVSETGLVYTYATPGLKPVIAHEEGKRVISKALKGELKLEGEEGQAQDPEDGGGDIMMGMGEEMSSSSSNLLSLKPPPFTRQVSSSSSQRSVPDLPTLPSLISQLPQIQRNMGQQSSQQAPVVDPDLAWIGPEAFNGLYSGPGSAASLFSTMPVPNFGLVSQQQHQQDQQQQQGYSTQNTTQFSVPWKATSTAAASAFTSATSATPTSSLPLAPPLPSAVAANDRPTGPLVIHQTPYERAAAEHAETFAQYQARGSTHSAPILRSPSGYSLAPASSTVPGASKSPLHGIHELSAAAKAWQPLGDRETAPSAASGEGSLEERRREWKQMADEALAEAKKTMSLSGLIKAHRLQYKASMAIPPLLRTPAPPTFGMEWLLEVFADMCTSNEVDNLDVLATASRAFVHNFIPAHPNYVPQWGEDAKQYLNMFFEFLLSHNMIDADKYNMLIAYPPLRSSARTVDSQSPPDSDTNASANKATASDSTVVPESATTAAPVPDPASPTRQNAVVTGFCRWTTEVSALYGTQLAASDQDVDGRVEGWLDVWRVAKTFILLKTQDSENMNASRLSPFKVRVPATLAAHLRRNDSLYLELRRVQYQSSDTGQHADSSVAEKEVWVPVVSGPFDGSCGLEPGNAAFDVDPDLSDELKDAEAALELDKLNQEKIERVRLAERARALLSEGEFEEI